MHEEKEGAEKQQAAAEKGVGQRGERSEAAQTADGGDESNHASDANRRNKNGFYQTTGSIKIGLTTM
jgi:hypothetical protein